MANYKKQEHYFVKYPGKAPIEVSEEVYRVWAYGANKEATARRKYFSHTHIDADGNYVSTPSKIMPLESDTINLIDILADCTYEPQQNFERKMQLALLESALNAMPTEYRIIIENLYFEGISETALAVLCNVTQPAIAARKRRALAWLRRYFAVNDITAEDFNLWL